MKKITCKELAEYFSNTLFQVLLKYPNKELSKEFEKELKKYANGETEE